MNMNQVSIFSRSTIFHNGKAIVDFKPFFGGRNHGSGCTNCDWEIRGVAKLLERDDRRTQIAILTGGCCVGFIIEAWVRPDDTVEMGALLRLPKAPSAIIPLLHSQEDGVLVSNMTYLVTYSGFDGKVKDQTNGFYDGVAFVSYYHDNGVPKELLRAESQSLTGSSNNHGRLEGKKEAKAILETYPELLDEVQTLIKRDGFSKEATLAWASDKTNVLNAFWCS